MAVLAYVSCIHEQPPTMRCASAVSRPKTQQPSWCMMHGGQSALSRTIRTASQSRSHAPLPAYVSRLAHQRPAVSWREHSSRTHTACCIPAARPQEVATKLMTQTTPQGQHMWPVHATPKADDAAQHITHSPCRSYSRQHHAPPKPCAQAHMQLARCMPLLKIWLARGPAACNG